MRLILLSALLGAALWPVAGQAADLAERLQQAGRQGFQGAFIYERNGSFSTHAIWHQGGANGRERVLQLDGEPREVLRAGGRTQCLSGLPADSLAEPPGAVGGLVVERLLASYELRELGPSRVAGRAATALVLIPRDPHRYAFEMHLDDDSDQPLKTLLVSEKGALLERFQFVDFALREDFSATELPEPADCRALSDPARITLDPAEQGWRPGWLPAGFAPGQALLQSSAGVPVLWLRYDDGLAHFSIFVESLQGESAENARSQLGGTSLVARRLSTPAGEVMVTVVGEIPQGTAERIALSMQSVPAAMN